MPLPYMVLQMRSHTKLIIGLQQINKTFDGLSWYTMQLQASVVTHFFLRIRVSAMMQSGYV